MAETPDEEMIKRNLINEKERMRKLEKFKAKGVMEDSKQFKEVETILSEIYYS